MTKRTMILLLILLATLFVAGCAPKGTNPGEEGAPPLGRNGRIVGVCPPDRVCTMAYSPSRNTYGLMYPELGTVVTFDAYGSVVEIEDAGDYIELDVDVNEFTIQRTQ